MTGDWRIITGKVEESLAGLGLFDAAMGDAPYGLGFMGMEWDHGVPSAAVWRSVRAQLRPGAPMGIFGGTRTFHRLMVAIEDAGFNIRPTIRIEGYDETLVHAWVQGQGGGWQGQNISKAIDKKLGAKPEVLGRNPNARNARAGKDNRTMGTSTAGAPLSAPGSSEAERFNGYHTMLAPAWEPFVMAENPPEGTYAENALKHGVAGLNVDACRIGKGSPKMPPNSGTAFGRMNDDSWTAKPRAARITGKGRWPANLILLCHEDVCGPGDPRLIRHQPGCRVFELDAQSGERASGAKRPRHRSTTTRNVYGQQSGWDKASLANRGGASRFFYVAKVSAKERAGCAHRCMKPLELCTYLARLLLPPPRSDGQPRRILVPYSGTGSEMIGALAAGWDSVVGIEMKPQWAAAAHWRIGEWEGSLTVDDIRSDGSVVNAGQLGLFGKPTQ